MNYLHVRTSGGIFGFVGAVHIDRPRPVLLAVNGSFPNDTYLRDLPARYPGANVLIVDLPAMGSPWMASDVPRMTKGLGEAVTHLTRDLPLVVYGASTGNLLSLGLQMPTVFAKVAYEPFLSTDSLGPFFEFVRGYVARCPEETDVRQYMEAIFGVTIEIDDGMVVERHQRQDWGYLADGLTVPTDVVVGSIPSTTKLEVGWPSLTSEEDRDRLRRNPLVTIHEGPPNTGHDVAVKGAGKQLAERLIHAALLKASERCVQPDGSRAAR